MSSPLTTNLHKEETNVIGSQEIDFKVADSQGNDDAISIGMQGRSTTAAWQRIPDSRDSLVE